MYIERDIMTEDAVQVKNYAILQFIRPCLHFPHQNCPGRPTVKLSDQDGSAAALRDP